MRPHSLSSSGDPPRGLSTGSMGQAAQSGEQGRLRTTRHGSRRPCSVWPKEPPVQVSGAGDRWLWFPAGRSRATACRPSVRCSRLCRGCGAVFTLVDGLAPIGYNVACVGFRGLGLRGHLVETIRSRDYALLAGALSCVPLGRWFWLSERGSFLPGMLACGECSAAGLNGMSNSRTTGPLRGFDHRIPGGPSGCRHGPLGAGKGRVARRRSCRPGQMGGNGSMGFQPMRRCGDELA